MQLPTMGDQLRLNARYLPEREAVEDGPRRVTYRALNERVNRLANGLHGLGVGPADVVGILLENRLEHVEAIYAAAKLGAVAVPLDVKWGPSELGAMLGFFAPRVLIHEAGLSDLLAASDAPPGLLTVAVAEAGAARGARDYEGLLAAAAPDEPPGAAAEDSMFLLMLTSGTTGIPKACVATQRCYVLRSLHYSIMQPITRDDVCLINMPLYFNAGRGTALAHLFHGGKIVLMRRFDAVEVLQAIERTRATNFTMVAAMADRLLQAPELGTTDLSSLRWVRLTGSVLHTTTKEGLLARLTPNLTNNYGTTDTGALTMLYGHEQLSKHGSVGRPIWGVDVRIVDDAVRDLPPGELGEVICRGPLVCDGYYRHPEATAEAFRDGWFHTGDLGRFDADGYLYLVGRKKDMIKSGGISVFPDEIEECLNAHPAVRESAVVGVTDPRWGEAVHAFVAVAPGQQLSEADAIAYCREHLAHYKAPKMVTFLDALPRLPNGKIAKQLLR